MRLRTFLLLILVLLVGAAAVFLFIANSSDGGFLSGVLPGRSDSTASITAPLGNADAGTEESAPPLEPTPSVRLEPVIVAKVDLPVGTRITEELIDIELRPNTNIAFVGNYTFSDSEDVIGKLTRIDVAKDQAILSPMLALAASDLGSIGSDLSLYIDQGKVAVAFPINQLSGAAFAMRPGDLVDMLMTLRVVAIDPEFRSALPNFIQYVIEPELREGGSFLLPDTTPQGRLEFIEEIGQVAEIVPSQIFLSNQDFEPGSPIPKRITQLTIQQAEVLWVGTWQDQDELKKQVEDEASATDVLEEETQPPRPRVICRNYYTSRVVSCPYFIHAVTPDVTILSMTSQDALALKYALERGIDIDLALRAQGDETTFVTASVTLPQIVEQGGLNIPPPADFDLHPRPEEVDRPYLPSRPTEDESYNENIDS